jgi:hypothetical protein
VARVPTVRSGDELSLDLKRALLVLRTMPKEFTSYAATRTDDVADSVVDLVRSRTPSGPYGDVYRRIGSRVTTGKPGARGGKLQHVIELRVPITRTLFSGLRAGGKYHPNLIAYWYEFGAKGGDDYVDVTLSTGSTKSVRRDDFDAYAVNAQRQYVERFTRRDGSTGSRVAARRMPGAEQVRITDVGESSRTSQLPPYSKAGHWITPTLDASADDVYDAWLAALDAALADWNADNG